MNYDLTLVGLPPEPTSSPPLIKRIILLLLLLLPGSEGVILLTSVVGVKELLEPLNKGFEGRKNWMETKVLQQTGHNMGQL